MHLSMVILRGTGTRLVKLGTAHTDRATGESAKILQTNWVESGLLHCELGRRAARGSGVRLSFGLLHRSAEYLCTCRSICSQGPFQYEVRRMSFFTLLTSIRCGQGPAAALSSCPFFQPTTCAPNGNKRPSCVVGRHLGGCRDGGSERTLRAVTPR